MLIFVVWVQGSHVYFFIISFSLCLLWSQFAWRDELFLFSNFTLNNTFSIAAFPIKNMVQNTHIGWLSWHCLEIVIKLDFGVFIATFFYCKQWNVCQLDQFILSVFNTYRSSRRVDVFSGLLRFCVSFDNSKKVLL